MANQVVPHEAHKYAFHVSGPRSLTSVSWTDIFSSSWKDANYKQTAISCFTRAVYALEVDRQENRTQEDALARQWFIPFKYKLTQTLIDERDGSIFGAIFEWDQSAALADSVLIKPIGAPRAVLALRGTLLEWPTMWRDIEDDFRFVALESLKGSARFKVAMQALKSVCGTYGRRNVCIAGHSLGAGFALQLGKELAEEGIYMETHLFNPPSLSLSLSLGNIGENTQYVWNKLKSMLVSSNRAQVSNDADKTASVQLMSRIPWLSVLMDYAFGVDKWVPNLYVNNNDWICCFYIEDPNDGKIADRENMCPTNGEIAAKLFIVNKENQKFLEAHGLEQWWSSDAHGSKLMRRQLRSLNTASVFKITRLLYPPSVSPPMNLQDIGAMTKLVWFRLRSPLPSVVCLKDWIPQLSGLKDTCFWVGKWVRYLYAWSSYTDPVGTEELFVVSKEKLKFLAAHGLEQWWPSDAELQQAIHDSKLISWQPTTLYTITSKEVSHLFNLSSVSLTMSLSNIGQKAEFVWRWNRIKSMFSSCGEAQFSNDADTTSGVRLKSWMPRVFGLKDAFFVLGKWVPYLYSKIIDYISKQLGSLCYGKPSQVMHLFDLHSLSQAVSLRNTGEKVEFIWSRLKSMLHSSSNVADRTSGVLLKSWILLLSGLKDTIFGLTKCVLHLYVNKKDDIGEKMVIKVNMDPTNGQIAADLFVVSKEKLKFLVAHGLEQWFSSGAELQQAIHNSKLISRQLRYLYTTTPWELSHLFNPSCISLAMILSNIGERPEFVWKWNSIKSMINSGGEGQVSNDADKTSSVSLKSWIPPLSGLKDAVFGVAKWVPHLYVSKTDGIGEKMVDREDIYPTNGQIVAESFAASKEKQKFHGLYQWWSSDAELQQIIHISKLINSPLRSLYTSTPWQVAHLFNPPSISLAKSLIKAHGLEQCWSSDAVHQHASSQLRCAYTGAPLRASQGKSW